MEQLTKQQLQAIVRAPESRQILQLLQESDGALFKQAINAAKAGNPLAAEELLKNVAQTPEVTTLLKKLQQRLG